MNRNQVLLSGQTLFLSNGTADTSIPDVITYQTQEMDRNGLSSPFLHVTYAAAGQEPAYIDLFPGSPFLRYSAPAEHKVCVGTARSAHVRIHTITLRDCSDDVDLLVKEELEWMYGSVETKGHMFILENIPDGTADIIVSEQPAYGVTTLQVKSGVFQLNTEYDYAVGRCDYAQACEAIRTYYRQGYRGERRQCAFIMSNTWGDRNCDKALCHSFVMKEIDTAAQLGVDIMQLDDGWQKGTTANSKIKTGVWEGYYAYDPQFWDVHPEKFPDSFCSISRRAAEKGVTMGLWFSPDSSENFQNTDRDIDVISAMHRDFGVSYFKLDGVKIRNKVCEARYYRFLEKLAAAKQGNISFNLDITAERRFGYWFGREFGTLFVENRYTDSGRYYPFRTLKNLWTLGHYIPTIKMQFEVLNPRRNAEKYGDDPVAPINYDVDYLFATVMTANPLIWMELQNLPEPDQQALAQIIADYKKFRAEMYPCDVSPIGQTPDGHAFSGFHVRGAGFGHLILLRDVTQAAGFTFEIANLPAGAHAETIRSNCACSYTLSGQAIHAEFEKPRSYLWLRYGL